LLIDKALIQQETLTILEWHKLCQHLSTFAATKLGAIASRSLNIPHQKSDSLKLLAQTQEISTIEANLNPNWSFTGIHDIGESLERASFGGLLLGNELLNIATTLAGVRRLRRVIDAQEQSPTLQDLVAHIRTFPEIEQEIHYCLDERGEITDRASPSLAEIRTKLKSLGERIRQILQNIMQRQGSALQEAVITQRGDRFVLPVKASHSGQISGIVHDSSASGSTLYVEPRSIIDLGNQLQTAKRQEKREEEIILGNLTKKVTAVHEELELLLAVATALDLATAKARYSKWLDAYPPQFIDFKEGESITIRGLHHPLLLWQQKHEGGSEVVPIDILIQPEIRVVAITGPNTGGKTVTLKTFGLAALMAKVGLFIPAKEPIEIPWFDSILADIGDEQSLEQNLSTFSGHIKRIIRIISALDQGNCLVLLDEIGAGTDPTEGTAIAIALLKYLAHHNLLTIATTHYGELKTLKYNDSRFENASVEFDQDSMQPTYRLLWGIPGRSKALTIAHRLGLNNEIIAEAKELVGGYSQEVNQLIAALEEQRREQENKHQQARELLRQTELFYEEVSQKAAYLQERERDLKLSQEKAVQDLILTAKEEIAQVIRKLQKQGAPTAQDAHQATESLQEIGDRYLLPPKKTKPSYRPKLGERVRVLSIGQTAEVIDIEEEQAQLTIRFGLMKMTVPLTDIESLEGKKVEVAPKPPATVRPPKSSTPHPSRQLTKVRTSQNTVDIRGQRVHNVESLLEKAIASATEMGVLWIIHGKGTGRLREGVHEFLKGHPQVSSFELAPQNEGGSGVTVAYLV
jgi:DNA mismatch repair protein MutS2